MQFRAHKIIRLINIRWKILANKIRTPSISCLAEVYCSLSAVQNAISKLNWTCFLLWNQLSAYRPTGPRRVTGWFRANLFVFQIVRQLRQLGDTVRFVQWYDACRPPPFQVWFNHDAIWLELLACYSLDEGRTILILPTFQRRLQQRHQV